MFHNYFLVLFNFISVLTIYIWIWALYHSTHTHIYRIFIATFHITETSFIWNEIVHTYFCMNYFKVSFPHTFLLLSLFQLRMKISSKCQNFPSETKVWFSTISLLASSLETTSSLSSQEKLSEAPFKDMDGYLISKWINSGCNPHSAFMKSFHIQ